MNQHQQIKDANSYSDVCRVMGWSISGRNIARAKELCQKLAVTIKSNPRKSRRVKYPFIQKTCPVCDSVFETQAGHPKEKTVCSHACSNTHFRSGKDHPNYKNGNGTKYRVTAFEELEHRCNRCGWCVNENILEVHHKDRDRSNNDIDNLEVLCPNCHNLEHWESGDGRYHKRN